MPFVRIVPAALPRPRGLVFISGVAEVLGGFGLLLPRLRGAAGWGLIALHVAVFPANVNMAMNHIPMFDTPVSPALAWMRLPFHAPFIV